MKVVLVYLPVKAHVITFPIGLACLAKALERRGIDYEIVDLLVAGHERRDEVFQKRLSELDEPCLFGFSIIAGSGQVLEVERFAKMVREADPAHTIVYGGPLPSSAPEILLRNGTCDFVICGEGEESLPEFVTCGKDLSRVNGLAYLKDGEASEMVLNRKKRIREIDPYYPAPLERFDMDFYVNYLKEVDRGWDVSGSRGCRGNCSFCFRFSGPGLTVRSGESIFGEVDLVAKEYGMRKFAFTDENFLEGKEGFMRFVELLNERGISITFGGQTRIDQFDDEFCRLMVDNGLERLTFGGKRWTTRS